MSCCSGVKQARTLTIKLSFRPTASENYNLTIVATGSAGRWTGRAGANIDFGEAGGCGTKLLSGVQAISVRADLTCAENDNPVLGGFLDLIIPGTTSRFHLKSVPLTCVDGGPTCSAEWEYVFLGQYFGGGSILVTGQ